LVFDIHICQNRITKEYCKLIICRFLTGDYGIRRFDMRQMRVRVGESRKENLAGWKKTPILSILAMVLMLSSILSGCTDSSANVDAGIDAAQDAGLDITQDSDLDGDMDSGEECQDGPPIHCLLQELTASSVNPDYSEGKAIGLVVGVATPSSRYVTGFGATTLGGSTPPDADSIYEIGSVTKVYSGYLLARGIDHNELALTHTIEDTFGVNVPTGTERSITLLDLVTHTSGLSNFPDNVLYPGAINPAKDYTLDLLEEYLSTATLLHEPGTTYVYSNLGSGMVGFIAVNASGEVTFEALVQREICQPFGLVNTTTVLDAIQLLSKAQGYNSGSEAPSVDIGEPLHGGGMLRSTGNEVLRFFEGALSGTDPAWTLVTTPYRDSPNGVNAKTGFLLNIEDPEGNTYYSKNGGVPGFTSQVVFTLNPPALVVLMSNTANTQGLYTLAKTILAKLETFPDF
jgi:CubicO group peptidase (beta-lactamase class C family)